MDHTVRSKTNAPFVLLPTRHGPSCPDLARPPPVRVCRPLPSFGDCTAGRRGAACTPHREKCSSLREMIISLRGASSLAKIHRRRASPPLRGKCRRSECWERERAPPGTGIAMAARAPRRPAAPRAAHVGCLCWIVERSTSERVHPEKAPAKTWGGSPNIGSPGSADSTPILLPPAPYPYLVETPGAYLPRKRNSARVHSAHPTTTLPVRTSLRGQFVVHASQALAGSPSF